ncbi:adenosine kinase [Oceanibacterium hippocampi]|uniref:5-dehydro-2-deoxygluconokinase n=1 Tax=Oceanibacterium hippocampi TaxID=745714 RepID=A0A1Y5RIF1_9PROT|nr:adenosine kinase [Oceanibacterium hippocampi]SLN18355.1 5-dehydro-2-deoxygluconokinase [Oceanibacterium hippocampi]
MGKAELDVVGIGNAIVDVIGQVDDAFLAEHDLPKGAMILIDEPRANALYSLMGPAVEISGGSAGNTIAGLASLGARAAYIGKVKKDQLGQIFAHDIRAVGVRFETEMATEGPATARSLILVTPDAHRTMNTFLGACVDLGPEDVDPALIANAAVTYLEGYLFDPPRAKAAFRKAVEIAHGAGRRVSLSLSDSFCVERYRDEFRDFVANGVDILFANEAEITALYETTSFDEALQTVRDKCEIACLTRSEHGSVIVAGDEVHVVDPEPLDTALVDTTGAGDLYAAGFLHGFTAGRDLPTAGRIASIAAAEVIGHYGARPRVPLVDLVADRLGD